MQVYRDMDEYARSAGPCVAALGMFDGVHAGHAALIAEAVRQARARGVAAVAVTFDVNPLRVLRPECAPGDIQSLDEKLAALAALGLDATVCEAFTAEFARRPGEAFACDLADKLRVRAIVAGYNYTFGDRGACGPDELRRLGDELGFDVVIVPPVEMDGCAVSSTRVRQRLAEGDIAGVSELLGRPYELSGTVAHGKRLGRRLGFPTANLNIAPGRALPRAGVYICALNFGGEWLPGVLNIGSQPTVPSGHMTCEAHVLQDVGDVYGQYMTVRFIEFGRPERKFDGVEELREQVERDKANARAYFQVHDGLLAALNAECTPQNKLQITNLTFTNR